MRVLWACSDLLGYGTDGYERIDRWVARVAMEASESAQTSNNHGVWRQIKARRQRRRRDTHTQRDNKRSQRQRGSSSNTARTYLVEATREASAAAKARPRGRKSGSVREGGVWV
jgi:hypothetical protein